MSDMLDEGFMIKIDIDASSRAHSAKHRFNFISDLVGKDFRAIAIYRQYCLSSSTAIPTSYILNPKMRLGGEVIHGFDGALSSLELL